MALTREQLNHAATVLETIETTAANMRNIVMTAADGTTDHIVLTPEQLAELKARYLSQKPELVDLFNQLPG